ncbi:AraC family transcriptional regulator [Inquilinus sp. CAU 1745]|uniref:AraC family transcriptional regulator n=1 Tax=Inquilinus sp. CAU 1745 TaxID=3140369 RepID=UPI00325A446C
MTISAKILASGPGWRATEVTCRAGPADPSFEERHDRVCMAVVLEGTFGYRSSRGVATMTPGSVLLGNPGDCFACGHEHGVGDRCLSFHFDPAFFEDVVASIPGGTRLVLDRPALPPSALRTHLVIAADAAVLSTGELEEVALELAAGVVGVEAVGRTRRDARSKRIEELVRWMDEEVERPLPLHALAQIAGLSPYHLLREFKREIGITPHQYLLAGRLRRAAALLRQTPDPVLEIALNAGFNDLSEFNRRFRRTLGCTPGQFRRRSQESRGSARLVAAEALAAARPSARRAAS